MKKFIILFLVLQTSCSYKARFKRLVKKHPDLIKMVYFDTTISGVVYEIDTVIYRGFTDSFYIESKIKDTSILKDKYRIDKKGDRFQLEVYPDTIYIPDSIPYEVQVTLPGRIIEVDNTPKWIYFIEKNWLFLAFLTLSLTLIIRLFSKKSGG